MTRNSILREKIHKKTSKEKAHKKGVKEKFSEMLELPKELILDRPRLTMIGNCDLMIENYKGVVEFSCDCLRIRTGAGIIKIAGEGLVIREITSEDIILSGMIHTLEFSNAG